MERPPASTSEIAPSLYSRSSQRGTWIRKQVNPDSQAIEVTKCLHFSEDRLPNGSYNLGVKACATGTELAVSLICISHSPPPSWAAVCAASRMVKATQESQGSGSPQTNCKLGISNWAHFPRGPAIFSQF